MTSIMKLHDYMYKVKQRCIIVFIQSIIGPNLRQTMMAFFDYNHHIVQ